LAVSYFHTTLRLCRLTGIQPSLLLHPLDFLGRDDVQDLSFFPGMGLPSQRKLQLVSELLGSLSNEYRLVTLRQHAVEVSQTSKLAVLEPRFS
jgi:peptidoglycan-N-acetylglucosamine deacetylase